MSEPVKIAPVKFGSGELYVQVVDIKDIEATHTEDSGLHDTSAGTDELVDEMPRIHNLIQSVSNTISESFSNSKPEEWSVEFNIGFGGKARLPFVAEGSANASLKIKATWKA